MAAPIYTTEPMVTRALATEIRHDPASFVRHLENRARLRSFGAFDQVRCEGDERIDVLLEFHADRRSPGRDRHG